MSWQHDISEYYIWMEKQLSGGIGFPSNYDITKYQSMRQRASKVPLHVQVPRHLKTIDTAMKLIPRPLASTLEIKYTVKAESDKDRAEMCGIKYGTFKLNIIRATNFLDGCYAMDRVVNQHY